MLVRAIALSLALLIGIGTIIPLATQQTEAGPRKHRKHRHHRHYKKYSKAWWRQYRRQMRHRRALQARKRELRLIQLRLAQARAAEKAKPQGNTVAKTAPANTQKSDTKAVLPSGESAPSGWRPGQSSPSELQFRVDNSAGVQVGSASISVGGPAVSQPNGASRDRLCRGVAPTRPR